MRDDTIGSAGFAEDVTPAWGQAFPDWIDHLIALLSSGQMWPEASESRHAELAVAFEDWRRAALEFAEAGGSARDLVLEGYAGPSADRFREQAELLVAQGGGLPALADLAHAYALQHDSFARDTQYAKLVINVCFWITVTAIGTTALTTLIAPVTAAVARQVIGSCVQRFRAFVDEVIGWLAKAAGRRYAPGAMAKPALLSRPVTGKGLLARAVTSHAVREVPSEIAEGVMADAVAQREQLERGTRTSWDGKMTASSALGDGIGALLAGKVARPVSAIVGRLPGISALNRAAGGVPGVMNKIRRYPGEVLQTGLTSAAVAVPSGMLANGLIYNQWQLPTGESLLGAMMAGAARTNMAGPFSVDTFRAVLRPSDAPPPAATLARDLSGAAPRDVGAPESSGAARQADASVRPGVAGHVGPAGQVSASGHALSPGYAGQALDGRAGSANGPGHQGTAPPSGTQPAGRDRMPASQPEPVGRTEPTQRAGVGAESPRDGVGQRTSGADSPRDLPGRPAQQPHDSSRQAVPDSARPDPSFDKVRELLVSTRLDTPAPAGFAGDGVRAAATDATPAAADGTVTTPSAARSSAPPATQPGLTPAEPPGAASTTQSGVSPAHAPATQPGVSPAPTTSAPHSAPAPDLAFAAGPHVELHGLDTEVSHKVTDAMRRLRQDYEPAFRALKHIRSADFAEIGDPNVRDLDAFATTGDQPGLYFSISALNERAALPELGASEEATGWTVPGGGSIEGVVHHEFGHHLATRLLDDPAVRGELNMAVLDVLRSYDGSLPEAVERNLSTYGATNAHDMIAEAFTEHRLAESPRPLARAIGQVIDRHHSPENLPWTGGSPRELIHARTRPPFGHDPQGGGFHSRVDPLTISRAVRIEQEYKAALEDISVTGYLRLRETREELVSFMEELGLRDMRNWRRFRDSFDVTSETRSFYVRRMMEHFEIPLNRLVEPGAQQQRPPAEPTPAPSASHSIRDHGLPPSRGDETPPSDPAPRLEPKHEPEPSPPPSPTPEAPEAVIPEAVIPDETRPPTPWREAADEARRIDELPFKQAIDAAAVLIDRYNLGDLRNWEGFVGEFKQNTRAQLFIGGEVSQRFGIGLNKLFPPQPEPYKRAPAQQDAASSRPPDVSEARRIAQIFLNDPLAGMDRAWACDEATRLIDEHNLGNLSNWRRLKEQLQPEHVAFWATNVAVHCKIPRRKLYEDPQPSREEELRRRRITSEEWRRGHHAGRLNVGFRRVTFDDGTHGVLRPDKETPAGTGGRSGREVSAYRLDQMLGFGHVPTTTAWDWDGKRDTMQEYMPDLRTVSSVDDFPEREQEMIAVRHYLTGHGDSNWGNLGRSATGGVVEFDFEHAFPESAKQPILSNFVARFISTARPLSEETMTKVRKLDPAGIGDMLRSEGIDDEAISGALARLNEMRERGAITGEAWPGRIVDTEGRSVSRRRSTRPPIDDDDDFDGPVFDPTTGVLG
ncbi:hypothetical protein ABT294_26760 [Nonomuraea sp. NPDC000554]|uniref:WXG100-like domain-containing protein n=1 Tax=Nonomuraea sp. NPDC000554 TaxID=3154259 RepID=UPI0033213913